MADWQPEDGPFPKPAWKPRRSMTPQDWWDKVCWQRQEISRLTAELEECREYLDYYRESHGTS